MTEIPRRKKSTTTPTPPKKTEEEVMIENLNRMVEEFKRKRIHIGHSSHYPRFAVDHNRRGPR